MPFHDADDSRPATNKRITAWGRHVLFVGLCLAGLTALAAGLLQSDPIQDPIDFDPRRTERDSYRTVIDQVDREWQAYWQEHDSSPTSPASDLQIARRLSLSLTGTIPSLEEIRAIQARPEHECVEWFVSRLLEDRRYADYFAERLARAYVGTDNGPFLVYRRRRFVTWLSDRVHENMPYDELVRRLISDNGLWTDSPAVNFVSVTVDGNEGGQPDPIRLAGRTARAFLGIRIDCLQCHDDNLGNVTLGSKDKPRGGLQSDFHKLAAFFSEAQSSLLGINDGSDKAYQYKYLDADEETVVEPEAPFLPQLLTAAETRRQTLAQWVTHDQNQAFARAIVNRVWALMFGKPLIEPIDDIPLFETEYVKYPPGMEALAADFVEHGCDLRRLIRIIAATSVFQLDSRADFEVLPEHEACWAVFPLTRLRPEQMAGGVIQASSLTTIDANAHVISQLRRFTEQNNFIQRYGDTGEDEFEDRAGTIAQRLLMMNGELVKGRSEKNLVSNAATQIGLLAPTDRKAIETAYLVVLTRHPSQTELEHFTARLAGSRGDRRSERLEDLYWILVNSSEFSWNH